MAASPHRTAVKAQAAILAVLAANPDEYLSIRVVAGLAAVSMQTAEKYISIWVQSGILDQGQAAPNPGQVRRSRLDQGGYRLARRGTGPPETGSIATRLRVEQGRAAELRELAGQLSGRLFDLHAGFAERLHDIDHRYAASLAALNGEQPGGEGTTA
jgi:hypothetical protein